MHYRNKTKYKKNQEKVENDDYFSRPDKELEIPLNSYQKEMNNLQAPECIFEEKAWNAFDRRIENF